MKTGVCSSGLLQPERALRERRIATMMKKKKKKKKS